MSEGEDWTIRDDMAREICLLFDSKFSPDGARLLPNIALEMVDAAIVGATNAGYVLVPRAAERSIMLAASEMNYSGAHYIVGDPDVVWARFVAAATVKPSHIGEKLEPWQRGIMRGFFWWLRRPTSQH